jgi:hypothetical protein
MLTLAIDNSQKPRVRVKARSRRASEPDPENLLRPEFRWSPSCASRDVRAVADAMDAGLITGVALATVAPSGEAGTAFAIGHPSNVTMLLGALEIVKARIMHGYIEGVP